MWLATLLSCSEFATLLGIQWCCSWLFDSALEQWSRAIKVTFPANRIKDSMKQCAILLSFCASLVCSRVLIGRYSMYIFWNPVTIWLLTTDTRSHQVSHDHEHTSTWIQSIFSQEQSNTIVKLPLSSSNLAWLCDTFSHKN